MQKLVLRNDNELREHNHIPHDKYAMEISDEYMDSSTINKSKLEDTKIKSGQRHFLFCLLRLVRISYM